MHLYLDTGSVKEIREVASWGILDGITTNPSLIAKEGGRSLDEVVAEICSIVDGPISAEVISEDAPGMIKEGLRLAAIHKNIVVKCPITVEGLKATGALTARGHRVNVTLVFQPAQALLAAKAGAWCVSPFIGRLDDISKNGMEIVKDIVTIFRNYQYKTKVLVASIRNPPHVVEAAKIGADIATMPYSVMQQLVKHPLTDIGLKKFLDDHKKAQPTVLTVQVPKG
ncbi:MAG TPA: fructose-6-phosphate aldolase [Thermoplasmata archaeon]|nr:fructose-6-phosphate aldolase [Thermoplasmata archaeon]